MNNNSPIGKFIKIVENMPKKRKHFISPFEYGYLYFITLRVITIFN